MKAPEFMTDLEIIDMYHELSQKTNEAVCERVTGQKSIIDWLENIQSENDWRRIRVYLCLLEKTAGELTMGRRRLALDMFYEMMFHQSGTVRGLVAQTVGRIIAASGKDMPVVWEEYLRKILFPDAVLEEKQKNWTAFSLRQVLAAILEHTTLEEQKRILSIYEAYFKSCKWGESVCINLISGILEIPSTSFTNLQKHEIFGFARQILSTGQEEIRTLSLLLLKKWLEGGWKPQEDEKRYMERLGVRPDRPYCENYLRRQIRYLLSKTENQDTELELEPTAMLIQKNLHLDNLWVSKVVHLEILKRRYLGLSRSSKESGDLFQYATHLLNVLCMNTDAVVFRYAGEELIQIIPRLEGHQKYEIFQEALKEIEMGMDSSNYIPSFLGRTFSYLRREDQKDVAKQFEALLGNRNPELVKTALEIICEIVEHQKDIDLEDVNFLMGLLSRGMFSYIPAIAAEGFFLSGTRIFTLCDETAERMAPRFMGLARKLLIYWRNKEANLQALWPALVFEQVDKFFETHRHFAEREQLDKVAFFSASFDPFSEKDKAIVREIRNMGFAVSLYIHDFSWFKNTQPAHIRRQITYLSIADLPDVMLFPENITINMANEADLKKLRALYPGKEVYIVAERDDIEKNEFYWAEGGENSLCNFPHIIFEGNQEFGHQMDSVALRQMIRAKSIFLQLPSRYSDVTSGMIRQRIAAGKKISDYVDPQAQSMILDWRLYLDKPVFKRAALTKPIDRVILPAREMQEFMKRTRVMFDEYIYLDPRDTCVAITDAREGGAICGIAAFRDVTLNDLYQECGDFDMVSEIAEQISGELLLLTGVYGNDTLSDDFRKIVLQEMLAYCQTKPYSYMIQMRRDDRGDEKRLRAVGFVPVEGYPTVRILDMRHSVVLFMDTASVLREPYNKEPKVLEAIRRSQDRLQSAVNTLYPGMMILGFQTDILNHRLIQLIREDNGCGNEKNDKEYGEKIYVPFGKILKGVRIPNTITKELNTEKIYAGDLSKFEIREFPEYPSMLSQIRNIKSFARPIVFVDDIYHKGHRIHQISQYLNRENMQVGNMITGVISGRGQNLASMNGIHIDAVHTVPNMKAWILESDMYPFVGGDGMESEKQQDEHMTALPSINFVLPYQMPAFMKNTSSEAIYNMSEICLENALDIYEALEKIYQKKTHKTLTIDRLGEVLSEPRYPESIDRHVGQEVKISEYLKQEKKKLKRLERMKLL